MAPDWRKIAFRHMDEKHDALNELKILRIQHDELTQKHARLLYMDMWICIIGAWVLGLIGVFAMN